MYVCTYVAYVAYVRKSVVQYSYLNTLVEGKRIDVFFLEFE